MAGGAGSAGASGFSASGFSASGLGSPFSSAFFSSFESAGSLSFDASASFSTAGSDVPGPVVETCTSSVGGFSGSSPCGTFTSACSDLCVPGGVFSPTVTVQTTSSISGVIITGSAVACGGSPASVASACPVQSPSCVSFANTDVV